MLVAQLEMGIILKEFGCMHGLVLSIWFPC